MIRPALFKFREFSRKQKYVLTWWMDNSPYKDKDGIICDGAIRSGKTVVMSLSFVMWAMRIFEGQNFALCGKTIDSLNRNVIIQLKKMLLSRKYDVQEKKKEKVLIIRKNGKENYFYMFGGKDESSQDLIQGLTLAGVFFDEVALMPESFVNQATGRCSISGSKFWFNCNPDNPRHWFKENWIDKIKEKNLIRIHFLMNDNTSLSKGIIKRYISMYTGVFYRRFILGEWCIADGLVYPNFDREKHVRSDKINGSQFFVSVDYGTKNAFSAGLWIFNGRQAMRIKEFYYDSQKHDNKRLDNEEYYNRLKELIGDLPIQYIVIDPSAASMIETIQKYGEYLVVAADNDVIEGIQTVTTMLNAGVLLFHDSCENTFEEFDTYSWLDKPEKEEVVKLNDHAMDEIRYFCYTVLRIELMWEF